MIDKEQTGIRLISILRKIRTQHRSSNSMSNLNLSQLPSTGSAIRDLMLGLKRKSKKGRYLFRFQYEMLKYNHFIFNLSVLTHPLAALVYRAYPTLLQRRDKLTKRPDCVKFCHLGFFIYQFSTTPVVLTLVSSLYIKVLTLV
jgi:hypothetical protein